MVRITSPYAPYPYLPYIDFGLRRFYTLRQRTNMATPISLIEVDSLTALVIIDNELDVISPPAPSTVAAEGNLVHIAMRGPHVHDRGETIKQLNMNQICCGAWGLSVLLVRIEALFDVPITLRQLT